jgi:hypothetical protein
MKTSNPKNKQRLFFTTLHEAVIPRAPENDVEKKKRIERTPKTLGIFAEALLFSDQIVLNVNGPNLELPLLVNSFGFKNVCELLESDTIQFSFCPGAITYLSTKALESLKLKTSPGITRLFGTDPEFTDVFESADKALKEQTNLNREERRFLARQVYRNTKKLPDRKVFEEALRLANSDIKSNLGKELGFSTKDFPEKGDFINEKERSMIDITNYNMIYLSMLLNKCNDLISNPLGYRILQNRVVVEPQYRDKIKISENIFSFEGIPNINELFAINKLNIEDILDIRKSKHLREFRNWIGMLPQESNEKEVIKAYRHEIDKKISSKLSYKVLKIGVMTGVGAGIGSIGGLPGSIIGGAITDLVLGFGDIFFIDKLIDGWNPKIFIEKEIVNRINK